MASQNRSNADLTSKISKSIFVTNFPDSTTSSDLWKLCQSYGSVVDVYIPNRRSKAGKRFAFVRFIKVDNVDRLVGNLCTLWIGRMHLHANVVRFERSPLLTSRPPTNRAPNSAPTYASAAKGILSTSLSVVPALVLDDSCTVNHDLENNVMGEVKQFSSINNLPVLLSNEGFSNVRIVYLGGHWVMIELPSAKAKSKLMKHVGVASGVPMHAWSRNTFHKIGSKWGEVLDLEESRDDFFARKRVCIKTNQEDNILEKFKIIVKGKIFVIRAKELFMWSPSFTEVAVKDYNSEDETEKEIGENHSAHVQQVNMEEESDDEVISDTVFGENVNEVDNADDSVHKETSKKSAVSILGILEEMIKVGQTMGFTMDGCTNDMEKIIGSQGVDGVFR
ncbi:RNA-directed DNA polymerase, eukaryota [Tanacetum coccineum]